MCLSSLLAPPSRCLSSNRYVECLYVRSQCSCHVCTCLVFPTAICDINLQHFHLSHQAQTVQQVQHVYPAQVQYVEENSGVYTNGNMWVNLLLSSALNTTWQILALSPSRLLFLLLSLFTPSFMSQAHGVGGSAFIFVCACMVFFAFSHKCAVVYSIPLSHLNMMRSRVVFYALTLCVPWVCTTILRTVNKPKLSTYTHIRISTDGHGVCPGNT